jgi:hypothetical protein
MYTTLLADLVGLVSTFRSSQRLMFDRDYREVADADSLWQDPGSGAELDVVRQVRRLLPAQVTVVARRTCCMIQHLRAVHLSEGVESAQEEQWGTASGCPQAAAFPAAPQVAARRVVHRDAEVVLKQPQERAMLPCRSSLHDRRETGQRGPVSIAQAISSFGSWDCDVTGYRLLLCYSRLHY